MHILFTVTDFDMGGITASMQNLSGALLRRGHTVSILNLPNDLNGTQFDPRIRILPITGKALYWNLGIGAYHNAHGMQKLKLLFFGIGKKLLNKLGLWEKFIFSAMPVIECDIAIAYRQSAACYYICRHKTTARQAIAFIHSEFDGNCSSWLAPLKNMDKIACVSEDWSNKFQKTFPHLQDKVHTVYNLFNPSLLQEKANRFTPEEMQNARFHIVTVSRLVFWPKRLDMIPDICKLLLKKGISDFQWTIVGDGEDRKKLEDLVAETGMGTHICLTGAKENPYPYVKQADLFVLLSDCESYGMVIQESLILGTPVLASDYPALHEIMQNRVHGLITQKDAESIANGIANLCQDQNLYRQVKETCMQYRYNPDTVYQQFLSICE